MFKFTSYVMKFAPFGVGAAMAAAIGHKGLGVLVNLGLLIFSLYLALALFILGVLGPVAWIARVPIRKFLRAVREPCTIAFATTSSESALPKAMELMERLGFAHRGFVMPTDIVLTSTGQPLSGQPVFVCRQLNFHWHPFWIGRQLLMMLTLMITSKGEPPSRFVNDLVMTLCFWLLG
jgi:proton glutamate symport protein